MTPTPRPWKVGYPTDGTGITGPRTAPSVFWDETDVVSVPIVAGKEAVAWIAESGGDIKKLEADAALIVRAVNTVDPLAEAVRWLMSTRRNADSPAGLEAEQKAVAALAAYDRGRG